METKDESAGQVPGPTPLPWLLHAYGHSIVQGGDDSWGAQFPNRFSSRLAARLRATEINRAQGASALITDNGPVRDGAEWATHGGWVTVMQTAVPEARTRGPVLCPQQLVVLMNGHLEAAVAGPERTPEVYGETLRAVLRRLRAGALYEDGDASVRASGPHERVPGRWRNSGDGFTRIDSNGASIEIAVPDWYPGGLAIDVGGVYVDGAAADIRIDVDGEPVGVHRVTALPTTTVGDACPEHTPWSFRIDGARLAPGAHQVRLTYDSLRGWGSFDYWQIEAVQPPLILLPEVARFPGEWHFAPVRTNFDPTDDDRAAMGAAQRAVASEFADGSVIVVPIQDLLPEGADVFTQDRLHPNALGHDLIAERLYDTVAQHWTRAHARGTGSAVPGPPRSPREIRIQRVRTRVGRMRRQLLRRPAKGPGG